MGAACFSKVVIENTGDDTYALWGADADPKDLSNISPIEALSSQWCAICFGTHTHTYLGFKMVSESTHELNPIDVL